MIDPNDTMDTNRGLPNCGITGCLAVAGAIVLSWLMVAGAIWVIEWIWRVI
jgi:hypothetical protein